MPKKVSTDKNSVPRYITKRDGRRETFYPEKITRAVQSAIVATHLHDDTLAGDVTAMVVAKISANDLGVEPNVEDIQDLVEQTLVELNQYEVAKAYILYRQDRSKVRSAHTKLMKTYQGIAIIDAANFNLKRDNANVDGDTAMGKMLQFGAEGSKEFSKTFLLAPEHARAHDSGDIHIHDLDFLAMGTLTCTQIDVKDLFDRGGFSTGHGHIRTPSNIASYAALAAIILQSNQNEQHGGQSIPNFDYAMADGVNKTFRKSLVENLHKLLVFKTETKVKLSDLKELIKNSADEAVYPKLTKKVSDGLVAGVNETAKNAGAKVKFTSDDLATVVKLAKEDTETQTYQAMEGLIHNLNTMHSRAGAQVPFTSINFGTDITEAGRLASKALLKATWEGLGHGETPIFPISILKVKEGVNFNPDDPNYDIFQEAIKVSAKRLFPNFVFLDAPYNLSSYKPGDYKSEVATMGCRTRVMASVFPESNGTPVSRGNISFTSINLPRIGLKHGIALGERQTPDWDGFYKELDSMMNLVADQLLARFEIQASKKVRNFPFLMGQGVWFGSLGLKPDDTLRDVIKHGTLSMGFIGLAETLVAMTGEHHGESKKAQKLGLEIVKRMRDFCDAMCQKYTLNFSLLATPAEGISGRFTAIDKEEYGEIAGVTDREYYTNSFHVPVYYKISAADKIDIEAPYHAFCNAGHITYIELDGDPLKNLGAFEAIVRRMKEKGVGYGSINHPVDRDPVCGYQGIISGNTCPGCGRLEGTEGIGFERLRRITGYLVGTLDRWNNAKRAEEHDRVKHDVGSGIKK